MKIFTAEKRFFAALPLALCMLCGGAFAQTTGILPDSVVSEIIAETSGDIALNNEMMLAPFERNRHEREYTGFYWGSRRTARSGTP